MDDDKMSIKFESSTGSASNQIGDLITKLDTLGKQTTATARALDKFATSMNNVGKTDVKPKGLDELKKSLDDMAKAEQITEFEKKIAKLDVTVLNTFSNIGKGITRVKEILGAVANTIEKVKKTFDKLKNGVKNVFSTIGKVIGTVGQVLSKIGSISKKTGSAIISTFRRVSKIFSATALALVGVRGIFTATRKAVSEYMNYDQTLSEQLRNNWAVLGSLIAPVLERIIGLFTKAVAYINAFVKALTGIDLVARANKKGLDSQTASAKKAVNELGNLATFDDLNVVNFDKDKGSGDDFKPLTVADIDTTPLDRFLDYLEAKDWYGIGMEIARKFNEGLAKIDFESSIQKAKEWGTNMGDLFNGLVDGLFSLDGIDLIGNQLANLTNTITGFFASFGDRAKFDKLGEGIAKSLNVAIDKINVEDLAKTLTLKWKAMINTFYGFVTKFNWDNFGAKIGELFTSMFNNIPWDNLARAIHDGIVGVFTSMETALDNVPWKEVGKKIGNFIDNMDASDIAKAFGRLLKKAFSSLSEFVSGIMENDKGKFVVFATGLALITGGLGKLFSKIKQGKDAKKDIEGTSDSLSFFQRIGQGLDNVLTSLGKGIESLGKTFESLGKATEIIAILGGLKLVLDSLNSLFQTFIESGMSISDIGITLAEVLGSIALSFVTLAGATKLISIEGIVGAIAILGGLTLTLKALDNIINSVAKSGMSMGDITKLLIGLVTTITSLVVAFTLASLVLTTNPMALAGLLALVGAISTILLVVKATLPTILDAVGRFITVIAPPTIALLNTIGSIIERIIYALGVTMPPIVNSIGSLFTSIFNGIAKVIRTVGDVIVDIMNTARDLITGVLDKIMWFVDNIGSAVENSVDHIIRAVTKVINFIVEGIEYLLNIVIVDPINAIINRINRTAIAEKLGWQLGTLKEVEIRRFAPKLATGTNRIEQEGLYHLHKNEAVVPEKYNPAVNNQVYENTNDRLIERIDRFMNIVENMETTNIFKVDGTQLYKGTKRYMDKQAEIYGVS